MRKLIQFLFIAVVLFLVDYVLINQAAILFLLTCGIIPLCGVIFAIRLLLFDQRNTSSKDAWVAVILILPVLATISYLVFVSHPATRPFSTPQVKEKTTLIHAIHAIPHNTTDTLPRLSNRIAHLTSIAPLNGTKIEILTLG
ncbi:PLDc N-terminal domain-containing protein, partial [Listeria monocytogenes]|uniref:PLDc N-terminal domain-containing protein n=1 Tax=Listeria monocytogenes TaxID=1639 RepID=UPI00057C6769